MLKATLGYCFSATSVRHSVCTTSTAIFSEASQYKLVFVDTRALVLSLNAFQVHALVMLLLARMITILRSYDIEVSCKLSQQQIHKLEYREPSQEAFCEQAKEQLFY